VKSAFDGHFVPLSWSKFAYDNTYLRNRVAAQSLSLGPLPGMAADNGLAGGFLALWRLRARTAGPVKPAASLRQ
jgi:hypothetical protein